MTRQYTVEYDYTDLAVVTIDDEALPLIKEMVEFWEPVDDGDDYVDSWLRSLGAFIIRHSRIPKVDEGWYPLDGTVGIKILQWDRWDVDHSGFTITETL